MPDPVPALAARVDELEQTARKAARDAGGSRWYHDANGHYVHTEPLGQPVVLGPHVCGLFAEGTHIAGHDPHAVMHLCRAVRKLLSDYQRATATATGANTPTARQSGTVGDLVAGQTSGYAAGIRHALAVLLDGLTPPDRTIDENGHASE